jgi:monoamine oxidase
MLSRPIPGGDVVDLGAEFIGPTQNHVRAIVDELRIATFPTYDAGRNVYVAGNSRTTYADTGLTGSAPPDPLILPDLLLATTALNRLSRQVPVHAPWEAARAGEYDGQSLETWLRRNTTGSRRFIEAASAGLGAVIGAELREVSLLFALFFIAASGDEGTPGTFERNVDTRHGAQQDRIAGGAQAIALALAQQLGRRVVRRSPVRRARCWASSAATRRGASGDSRTPSAGRPRSAASRPPSARGRCRRSTTSRWIGGRRRTRAAARSRSRLRAC